jgi:hypothetical protein
LVEFFVLKILFGLPTLELVLPWLLSSVLFVVLGAPLLRWGHRRSVQLKSPKPTILAVEIMFIGGLLPFGYFLIEQDGFDFWPLVGTSLTLLTPLALLYCRPPKPLVDLIQSGLKRIVGPDATTPIC